MKYSTVKALWLTFRKEMVVSGILFFFGVALRFVGPVLLQILISFIREYQINPAETSISLNGAYGIAVLMCLNQMLASLCACQADFITMKVGIKARDCLNAATIRHVCSLSHSSRSKTNNGLIFSLVSNDSNAALEFTRFWNQFWTAPFVLIAGVAYIQVLIGPSVWAGMTILILFVPFSTYLGKAQTRHQKQKMLETDLRVKLSSEALQGIRIVKFNAWESAIELLLQNVRSKEMKKLTSLEYVRAMTTPLSVAVPNIASVLTFITYVATGNVLDPAKTFAVVSLFVIIRAPFVTIPIAIAQISRVIVMNGRFNEFFKLEGSSDLIENNYVVDVEGDPKTMQVKPTIEENKPDNINRHIFIEADSEFSWGGIQKTEGEESTSVPFCLRIPFQIEIASKQLIAVVGSVGAGKSSLMLAILNEMNKIKGNVTIHGKIAYCTQEPFILNRTLKENILFGQNLDLELYEQCIELACLTGDLDQLPGRDETEIGERGVNLSGGQKSRVSYARALYSQADVYILDDPLSAVDAHIGKKIFEESILKLDATRILVTNNLHVLSSVDKIIVLVGGVITEFGTQEELLQNPNGALKFIMKEMIKEKETEVEKGEAELESVPKLMAQNSEPELFDGERLEENNESDQTKGNGEAYEIDLLVTEELKKEQEDEVEARTIQKILEPQRLLQNAQSSKLIATETRVRGKVSNKVMKTYWLSGARNSYFLIFLLLLCFAFAEAVFLAVDAYLASASQAAVSINVFLIVYICLTVGAIIGILLRSFSFALFHLEATRKIHVLATSKILRFPMSFYWKEPLGRLLNRLSADQNVVDTLLGQSWLWLLLTIVRVVGILCLICLAIPVFVAALLPLMFIYMLFREVYRRSARDLQRLESISKSPIMNILSETLNGTPTLRAFHVLPLWIHSSDDRIITNHQARFAVESIAIWLSLALEFLGAIVILMTSLIIVAYSSSIGSGFAGLALAYAFNIVINLNFSVKQAVLTEQQMSAVERLIEYSDLPPEANLDATDEDTKNDGKQDVAVASASIVSQQLLKLESWPTTGEIIFNNVCLKYRDDLHFALNNLSFKIEAGEHCGIVGKTGGGKSSLFVALLRLVDCSSGEMLIDGIDTRFVEKRKLRSSITIVPQDPVVFRNTLRYNLDPFDLCSDNEVWDALRASHIDRIAEASPDKLNMQIADSGSNLSVGERALVCLARAILRKSKIVCLDEASSSLDSNTDILIQKTIRERFENSTLLVIAHRLDTVIDLQTIIVMGGGKLIEKGSPKDLLSRKPVSAFGRLVDETGPANSKLLRERASKLSTTTSSSWTSNVQTAYV